MREPRELLIIRQVFPTWSVCVPHGFEETFVQEGLYWHAWDETRSISMASSRLTLPDGSPVPAADIAAQCAAAVEGERLHELPDGLVGAAGIIATDEGSRASRAISALLAADGYVMIATVTADDIEWAKRIFLSIQFRREDPPQSWERPTADRGTPPSSRRPRRGWDRRMH